MKHWDIVSQKHHILSVDKKEVISLNFLDRKNMNISLLNDEFSIKRKRSQSYSMQIFDKDNSLIAQTFRKKWYSKNITFQYKTLECIVKTRNNPLFEIVLQDTEKQDILGYKIEVQQGKQIVKITEYQDSVSEYLFDIILWIIFISTPRADTLKEFL